MAKKEPYAPADNLPRCGWIHDELDQTYHDTEWGVPLHDDARLFEMLILEGMQAGLSWSLILHRREGMRAAFDGFDPAIIAAYDDEKTAALLQNPAIIRNRAKVRALVGNAQAFLQVQQEFGSFNAYIWSFVEHTPIVGHWHTLEEVPTFTDASDAMSKALKKRGFRFVGTTICYSYMQATGMVNDHLAGCHFRRVKNN